MSSLGPGNTRGRGRGNGLYRGTLTPTNGARTPTATRGRGARGGSNARQHASSNRGAHAAYARGAASRSNGATRQDSRGVTFDGPLTSNNLEDRFKALKEAREKEKKKAIRDGLMNDPDKPIKLSEAITMVATCQDMCPQFERVDRARKKDIADAEKNPDRSVYGVDEIPMDEDRMVKSFKRSAAGDEMPLPSDLRTPHTLKHTLDYLLNEVLGNDNSTDHVGKVHGFLWDRTRAIRKDFSVQQLTKLDDLKIAIDCFERIARMHIVYLHILAVPEAMERYSYSHQQEIEQLDKTLLSLMQYYDDTRGRLNCKNEAEFRAYCVIFQLQDPQTPDLEDRVQTWPRHISGDLRVQEALKIYAAACNTSDLQGPFPSDKTPQVIARQDWARFWDLMASTRISYLMACVAEVYFNYVREMALKGIVGSAQQLRPGLENSTWTIDSLWDIFNFDTEVQLEHFCSHYGLQFKSKEDGTRYLAFSSKLLPPRSGHVQQQKSRLVENKRQGRSLPAVVDGLSISLARTSGRINDEELEDDVEEMQDVPSSHGDEDGEEDQSDEESLFVSESKKEAKSGTFPATAATPGFYLGQPAVNSFAASSPFGRPASAFGKPSTGSPFASKPAETVPGAPGTQVGATFMMPTAKPNPFGAPTPPVFKPVAEGLGITAPTTTAEKTAGTGTDPINSPKTQPDSISLFAPKTTLTSSSLFLTGPSFAAPTTSTAEKQSTPATQPTFNFGVANNTPAKSSTPAELAPKPAAPAFNWGQASSGSSATPVQPETNFKPQTTTQPQAQPHSNAPSTTSPPSQHAQEPSAPTFNPGSISPSRRQSINAGQDTRPKKPSPLKESFTAEASDHGTLSSTFGDTTKRPPQSTVVPSAAAEFDAIITRLADELTFESTAGILKQYVDFYVRRVVTQVQEQVYLERIDQEAAEHRQKRLSEKYFHKWRTQARAKYLRKRGNQSRQRRRNRLTRSLVEKGELDASVLDDLASERSSRASSRRPPTHVQRISEAQRIDAMFRSTNGNSSFQAQARAGSKRPAASLDGELMPSPNTPGHKRAKSSSHVDNDGRVAKTAVTSHPNSDLLQRSSFLGYSAADRGEARPSTTKSNYFRMKAMGLKPQTSDNYARGTKRQRSESLDAASARLDASRSRVGSLSLQSSTSDRPLEGSLTRPSPPSSVRSRTNDDDDALFARLRTAREALKEGADFMRSEMTKEDDFRRSRSASQSDRESPSMDIARSEARMRVSLGESNFGASSASNRDVPAYRLRESRFVPREQYSRAIERANEIRASRSQPGSRPESRIHERPSEPPAVQSSKFGASTTIHQSHESLLQEPEPITNGHSAANLAPPVQPPQSFGFGFNPQPISGAQSGFSQYIPAPNPFSQTVSTAPTVSTGQNPFLAVKPTAFGTTEKDSTNNSFSHPTKTPFGSFGFGAGAQGNATSQAHAQQPTFSFAAAQNFESGDHTIKSEQILHSLSNSFGHHDTHQRLAAQTTGGSPTPPQTNSYMPSQAASAPISLISDDEDGDEEVDAGNMPNGQEEFFNAMRKAAGSDNDEMEIASASYSFAPQPPSRGTCANQFAALADNDDEDQDDDEELDEHGDQRYDEDNRQEPDSYQYGDDLDDEALEGEDENYRLEMQNGGYSRSYNDEDSDEDGLEGEEGDIEDSDEDGYDEEDDDEEDQQPLYANAHFSRANHRAMPKPEALPVNSALQAVGNNKNEPIDLDSD